MELFGFSLFWMNVNMWYKGKEDVLLTFTFCNRLVVINFVKESN